MSSMQTPKMIMFDYGDTLCCEPQFSTFNDKAAAMKFAVSNPLGVTPEQAERLADELYEKYILGIRAVGGEITKIALNRLLYEYLQVDFSVTPEELELICLNAISPGAKMPNVEPMLKSLREHNIRSAVLSNNIFSGRALTSRINALIPDNDFEFIISTADYLIRKPDKMIFELALRKANLEPGDVWFCGDHVDKDVIGSRSAGMFPVWYEDLTNAAQYPEEILLREREGNNVALDFEHLHIHDWLELADALETLR